MAKKTYDKIVSGFTKTINECVARSKELEEAISCKEEKAASLLSEVNESIRERNKVEALTERLTKLAG